MSISSTINIPKFDEDKLDHYIKVISSYAHRLRGLTFYPDGARGGQPITKVPYEEAKIKLGEEFEDNLESNESCSICSV
jgi:ribonucleoside-diphosphate reductase alpha chain